MVRETQKQCYEMTHTVNRSSKFLTQTRQPNTTKSSLQNPRLRPGTKSKKPFGDLNTDGFTSILGSLVKYEHLLDSWSVLGQVASPSVFSGSSTF